MTGIVREQEPHPENAMSVNDHLHVVVLDPRMGVTDLPFVHKGESLHHRLPTELVRHLPSQPGTMMIEIATIDVIRVTILQETSLEGFHGKTITDLESGHAVRLVALHIHLAEPVPPLDLFHVVLHLPFIQIA